MSKNNAMRYAATQSEHYKMYKQGKMWAFALVSTLAIGVGGLTLGHSAVSADTSATPVTASTNADTSAASGSTVQLTTDSTATSSTASSATSSAASVTTSSAVNSAASSTASSASSSGSSNAATSSTATSSVTSGSAVSATPTSVTTSVASSAAATSATSSAVNSSAATSSAATQTLVEPTSTALSAAKSSAASQYAETSQAQAVNAVDAAQADTSNAVLKLSEPTAGYGSTKNTYDISLVITNPQAGDVYTVTIPADTEVLKFDSAAALDAAYGTTTTTKNADGTKTITDTFTASKAGVITQLISYNLNSNYGAQAKPMTEIGTVVKTVTYAVNGVEQTPVTFDQIIQPHASMSGMSLTYPAGNANTALQSGTEYVFSYNVGESDGVFDNQYPASRVNSADNYGTTLTIPVAAGFKLNADDTAKLNAFTDATTITQPGGAGTDIIITVPKGSGNQNWDKDDAAYKFAGTFTQAATSEDATYSAADGAVMNQTVDDAGTVYTAVGANIWSVVIAGTTSAVTTNGTLTAKGNSTTGPTQLVLDTDTTNDPSYLAQFTFANNTVSDQKNVQLQLDIPDGVVATGIVVPKGEVTNKNYLPGDLTYTYTMKLADGTTETGTAIGGATITSTNGAAIRQATLVVNELAAGATLTTTGDMTKNNTFSVLGTLNADFDDGTAVKNGDVLTFGISMTFDGQSAPAATAKVDETVTEPYAAVYDYVTQISQDAGATNAGSMAIMSTGNYAHTTDYIYEPVFYYVIPAATTFVSATNVDPTATVSEFTADDGRTVVKIDYTGTGLSVETKTYQVQINLANKADALPGVYTFAMYIYSPNTPLANDTKVEDASYTEGHTDAVRFYGGQGASSWTIKTAGIFTDYTFVQGTQDTDPVNAGTSNAYATTDSHFYVSLVNTANDGQDHDGTVIVNLPTEGDSEGSGFTFALSGPVTVPANYTVADGTGAALNATVLYSTSRAAVVNNQTSVDTSSYMTADQLAAAGIAWSDVRSLLISIADIASLTSTGRIDLAGTPVDGADHVDTTGYLETAFAIDGGAYSVTGKADGASSLTLRSYSTVTARYHYVDVNGDDQYIDIPDLTQTLENGVDKLATLPTTQDELSTVDQNLIPEGYELVGSYAVLAADGVTAGKAASGALASRDFDGDIIQYELQGKYAVTFNVVNDTTGETTVAKTVRGAAGQQATFTVDVPTGYVLSPTQDAGVTITNGSVNYTLTAADQQVVNVHVTKQSEQTYALHYTIAETTSTGTTLNSTSGDSSTQVTYVLLDKDDSDTATTITAATDQADTLTVPIDDGYTLVGIKATRNGETVTADVGTDAYNALLQQLALSVAGNVASFDAQTYYDQYFKDTFSVSADPNVDIQLIFAADPQTVSVIYKDADGNNQQVGATALVTGSTGATYNWTAVAPDGYKLASGQATTGSYTYTTDADQQIVIYLAHEHAHTTEARTYTVSYTGAPATKLPATKNQSVTWNEDVDVVTGAKAWTPQSTPAPVTVPTITGYQASDTAVAFVVTALSNEDPVDASKVVTYTALPQSTNIQYVDDDNGGVQVGDLVPLTGTTDATVAWTADVPTNYQLASGQAASGNYTFAGADNAPVVVHLTHTLTHGTATTSRTITYVVAEDAATAPAPVTQTVQWLTTTDLVTGATVATPQGNFAGVTSPYLTATTGDGAQTSWQPDVASVGAIQLTAQTGMPTDPAAVTVTYRPYAQVDTSDLHVWTKTQNGTGTSTDHPFAEVDTDDPHVWTKVQNGTGTSTDHPFAEVGTDDPHVWTKVQNGTGTSTDHPFAEVGTDDPHVWTKVQNGTGTSTDHPFAAVGTNDPHVWTKTQTGVPVSAEQYVVDFVTPTGKVVGTTQLGGNAGNKLAVTAPAGYHFVDADAGTVTLPDSNVQAITIVVAADTVDSGATTPSGNGNGGTMTSEGAGDFTHQLPATGGEATTTGSRAQGSGNTTGATKVTTTAARTLPTTGGTYSSLPATGGRTLPQTGDQQNAWAVLGVGLLTATLGFFGIKRRRDTQR